jgi:hypothetical protein
MGKPVKSVNTEGRQVTVKSAEQAKFGIIAKDKGLELGKYQYTRIPRFRPV